MKQLLFICGLGLAGCASYPYASQVKLVAFDDNLQKGQSSGPIRGEDCTWTVLGMQMGGLPTLDRAFINARNQAGSLESAGLSNGASGRQGGGPLRYVNNVSTEREGFNAVLFGKQCLVVKGTGYR
jgi:hypothetical protein